MLAATSNLLNFLDAMLSTDGIRNSGIARDLVVKSRGEVNEIVALVESAVPKLAEIAPSASANNARDEICAEIIEYSQSYQYKLDLGAHFHKDQYIRGILAIVKRKLSPVA